MRSQLRFWLTELAGGHPSRMDCMKRFPFGHITHPDWRIAVALVVAQIRGQMAQMAYTQAPNLGIVYFSDHFAQHAGALLEVLQDEFPGVTDWSGSVGVGVIASHAEYRGEPALAVMLAALPAHAYRLFSGVAPLPLAVASASSWQQALVHADADLPDLPGLLRELAERTQDAQLLGGVSSSVVAPVQLAWSKSHAPAHSGVLQGGLSGIAFAPHAGVLQASTQGCQAVSERLRITALQDNVLLTLNGYPALDVLEEVMQVRVDEQPEAATRKMRHIQVALETEEHEQRMYMGQLAPKAHVCALVGVDTQRRGIVLAESALHQRHLRFCQRNWTAARADLLRMCAELRETLSPADALFVQGGMAPQGVGEDVDTDAPTDSAERAIAGAVYISHIERGGDYFGANNGEIALLHQVLGDIPLVGMFSTGEIAGQQLNRYGGVLMLFTQPV